MASVDCGEVAASGTWRAEGGGGHEGGHCSLVPEEAKHGGPRVELTESVAEAGVRDDAAPTLADKGGADEACRVVRRDAEEDRLHEFIHQRRRHTSYRRLDLAGVE